MRDPAGGDIWVVDDGGVIVGTLARRYVVVPSMFGHPLEIAAAADFVTFPAPRRAREAGDDRRHPGGAEPGDRVS